MELSSSMSLSISDLFLLVGLGLVFFMFARLIREAIDNSKLPILTVSATVVAKRCHIGGGMTWSAGGTGRHRGRRGGVYNMSAYTTYYVTFESDSGQRFEYSVPGEEFGMLVEGDHGTLSQQGTRYKGFSRSLHDSTASDEVSASASGLPRACRMIEGNRSPFKARPAVVRP